ncbi:hypothetical protein [Microbacterium sp. CJ88]|uniref:hypothetical protein n=1 Tax=Microbacterium sp. CJ88 TaxID=3445672 RepID=UPI003F65DC1E
MIALAYGTGVGMALAFAALLFGFWGFVLVAVLGAVGALVALAMTGRIDLRAAVSAARGRRVA